MSETIEASSISNLNDLELRTELTRHGVEVGPIVPSTRKIYEKKLQNLLTGTGNIDNGENLLNGTMNGVETPMHSEINNSPKPTPRSTPAPNEQGSDDDDEPSESIRLLSPKEMHNFRRSFKSLDSPDSSVLRHRRDFRECSPPLGDTNPLFIPNRANCQKVEKKEFSTLKIFGLSFLFLAITSAFVLAMFWMRERLVPIFDSANDVEKGQ
ncbi:hypothetical protein niasHS_012412 [Heterodera schachtii]|uniref:LEM domain-containing protein n=1 Tax=Heterodera schachtii TaxID=97005 RepID=A0ABD2IMD4_HETSC